MKKMKTKLVKSRGNLGKMLRLPLMALLLSFVLPFTAVADELTEPWYLVAQLSDGTEELVPMSTVGSLVAADDAYDMSYTSCPDSHHPHLIDLGLPSGTKWACCNVGASKPEDYGGYYAWGETAEKRYYEWSTYIHCDGSYSTCHDIGSDIAGTQYDAATANWGSPWVMPNKEQMKELKDNCSSKSTTENGVYGRRFIGPNGASIFLPAAGGLWVGGFNSHYVGSHGYYWSSMLGGIFTYDVWQLYFESDGVLIQGSSRKNGQSVRPVRKN